MAENGFAEGYAVGADRMGSGGYGSGFGWGGDWIWIIVLFALWQNGGFGNGNGQGAMTNYTLASDFATLQRQLDSATNSLERKGDYIQEQICNSDQANAAQFAMVNTNLMNGFANVNQGISSNRYETQLAVNNLGSQLQKSWCDSRYDNLVNSNAIQQNLAGIRYDMASNTCALTTNANNNTRDIIENANANFRALHDEIIADRFEEKNEKIAELQAQLGQANLAASQARQNQYLVNALRPSPVPAYQVPNPYNYNGYGNVLGV